MIPCRAIVLALGAILLASCSILRPPKVIIRDSTRVVIRERVIHDTALFEVPVEVEKIATRDTSSHLENSLASSDAVVTGGLLHHSLKTKPQTIPVPAAVPVRDSIIYRDRTVEKEVTVEVERKPTWWERFRIGAFFWLLGFALIGWRRELLALLRKLL